MHVQFLSHPQNDLYIKSDQFSTRAAVAHGRKGVAGGDFDSAGSSRPVLFGKDLGAFIRAGPFFPYLLFFFFRYSTESPLPSLTLFAVLFKGESEICLAKAMGKKCQRPVLIDLQGTDRVAIKIGFHFPGFKGCHQICRRIVVKDRSCIRDFAPDQFFKGSTGDHTYVAPAQLFKFRVFRNGTLIRCRADRGGEQADHYRQRDQTRRYCLYYEYLLENHELETSVWNVDPFKNSMWNVYPLKTSMWSVDPLKTQCGISIRSMEIEAPDSEPLNLSAECLSAHWK